MCFLGGLLSSSVRMSTSLVSEVPLACVSWWRLLSLSVGLSTSLVSEVSMEFWVEVAVTVCQNV